LNLAEKSFLWIQNNFRVKNAFCERLKIQEKYQKRFPDILRILEMLLAPKKKKTPHKCYKEEINNFEISPF